METLDLEYFRGTLTQSLKDLLKKGNEAVSHLLESTADSSDLIDQATLETDRSFRLRMQDRENKLIHKIEKSLTKIDEGTFGICELCGEDIEIKRLKPDRLRLTVLSVKIEWRQLSWSPVFRPLAAFN